MSVPSLRAVCAVRLRLVALLLLSTLLSGCPRGGGDGATPDALIDAPSAGADLGGASYVKSYHVEGAELVVTHTAATADGGQYLAGRVHVGLPIQAEGLDTSGGRLAILRTDPLGDVLWARVYDEAARPGHVTRVVGVSEAPDGTIWVAGERERRARVLRLDADGQVERAFDYGSADEPVTLAALQATADGGFIAAGTVPGVAPEARVPGGGDLWLLEADRAGQQRRLQVLDGEPRAAEVPVDMRLGTDGELTVVGKQGRVYYKDDFWIAHFHSDLRLAFTETYTGITLSGEAKSSVALPRLPGSNVVESGIVAVGNSRGSRDVTGLDVHTRSRLVYLALPEGEQRQDEDVDVETDDDAAYEGVEAFRDPNTIVAAGWRDVRVPAADGEERAVRRGFLQVLAREPEGGGADAGRFVSERILPLQSLSPLIPDTFAPSALVRSRDGGYFLLVGSTDLLGVYVGSIVALDAGLRLRWIVDLASLPGTGDLGVVTRLVPTRDAGVLLVSLGGLVRLDATGTLRWARDLASPTAPPELGSVASVTALSQGGVLVGTSAGVAMRYAPDGTLLFARRFGGLLLSAVGELDRDEDGRGDALLIGGSRPRGAGGADDLALLRIGMGGGLIDARGIPGLGASAQGSRISRSGDRLLYGLRGGMLWLDGAGLPVQRWQMDGFTNTAVATPDGAIVRGKFRREGDSSIGARVVARFGLDGRPRWARRFDLLPAGIGAGTVEAGTVEQSEVLELLSLSASADGGVAVTGLVSRESGDTCASGFARRIQRDLGTTEQQFASIRCSDGLLLRLDADGNVRWRESFGTLRDDGLSLGADVPDNGALATGTSVGFSFPTATTFVVRTDADGRVGSSCVANETFDPEVQDTPVVVPAFTLMSVVSETTTVEASDLPLNRSAPISVTTARACSGAADSPLLQVAVTGDGRVTEDAAASLRAGIECPGDCSQRHSTGVRVPLVAEPGSGRAFTGWEGDCASFGAQARIVVTMDRSRSCTARFEARPTSRFGVTVALDEPTSASGNRVFSIPDGVECSSRNTGTCTARFDTTTEVRLQAVAGPDQRFAGWTGCDVSDTTSTPLCIVRGDGGDRRITARFEQVAVLDLTVALSEPGGSRSNRVLSFPTGIDCTSGGTGQCNVRVREGTVSVALTPSAEAGQRFAGWLGCDSVSTATEPQCFVTVRAGSRNVTAQFEAAPDSHEVRVVLEGRPQLDDDGSPATDRVRSNIGGILCDAAGTACSARFTQGTEVRLTLELDPTLSRAGFRSRLERWLECDLLEPVDVVAGVGQPPTCVIRQLNQDTEITARVRYIDDETFGGGAPVARVAITGQRSPEPNAVDEPARFDARGSSTEAGRRIISWEWDWNADGAYDCAQTEADPSQCITTAILPFGVAEHQYTRRGVATVGLRITDDVGRVRTLLRTFNVR